MSVLILHGSAAAIPLADKSVHAVCTSPPYYGLRMYSGVAPSVWGGDPSCAHAWGSQERGKRKDVLPSEESSAGRLGTHENSGGQNDGGRFCQTCGAWRGCLGNEPSPERFVSNLVAVFREIRRVLRDDGVCWLNLGDSFSNDTKWGGATGGKHVAALHGASGVGRERRETGVEGGNLLGVPWRVAFALQADGWILRNDVVWAKKSAMPESVSGTHWERHRVRVMRARPDAATPEPQRAGAWPDRPNQNHDGHDFDQRSSLRDCDGCAKCAANDGYVLRRGSWRHTRAHEVVFMLVKSMGYFCDADAVKEPLKPSSVARISQATFASQAGGEKDYANGTNANRSQRRTLENFAARYRSGNTQRVVAAEGERDRTNTHLGSSVPWEDDGTGRNPRSYAILGPSPTREAHFATYPPALIEPLILSSTSARGCCAKCGAPWARVVERAPNPSKYANVGEDMTGGAARTANPQTSAGLHRNNGNAQGEPARTLGWRATCSCPDAGDPVPCTVLDPFVGSGTTVRVAIKHRLRAVGIDASATYLREIADKRTRGVQVELGVDSGGDAS